MTKITRVKHTIDAEGKTPGRLAAAIGRLLIGKHKVDFAPNVDGGDSVEVLNAGKMKITGNKMEGKTYHRHTAHPGGYREENLKTVWAKNPGEVLYRAVSRMLPKNRHRNERLKRLSIKN